ncbi:MAG: extracellular solute-binding protein, partial [Ruminiclostridium sp.]
FRTGEAPIVIQNYCTFYNQLNRAAPEIKGLWDFTHVPGTVREDGTVSYAANSNGSGAIVLKDCKNDKAAWEFIKWFTSDEVMVRYGRTIEGQMGQMGRFDTANKNALAQLPWSNAEYEKISAQMSETREIPIIPASYATTRHVKNAFRAVVNDTWNPRYALSSYNRDINSEITRKNEDLNLFKK